MTKRLLYSFLYILCLGNVASLSCKKSINEDNVPVMPGVVYPIPAASPVTGTVSGLVLDENNTAVGSALVECAGVITHTDVNGFFNIINATLDKYITTVKVTRAGYFKAYRSFSANASRNYVNIKMIPKILTAAIQSSSGGVITLPNTTEISFRSNSMLIKSSGAAYSGTVNVYAHYIDPTGTDIASTVPGSFMGKDANNLYALQSAGMIAVDIESPSGEPLQLEANKPATIKLTIPASLAATAPATIATWSLDDEGVWKKEGIATKAGDQYEMLVTHFSFWNCDTPMNAVYLSLHITDQHGSSIANTCIQLKTVFNNWTQATYGITDSLGNVSGMVPSGVQLELNIMSSPYGCVSSPLYTQLIGPFTTNSSLVITGTFAGTQLVQILNISGTANDCSGQPIQHGTALIYSGQYFIYTTITNGTYAAFLTHCSPIVSVNANFWNDSNTLSAITGPFTVAGNAVTIPAASLCGIPMNIYDGVYQVTGSYSDITNAAYTASYPKEYSLVTTGLNSVYVVDDSLNGGIPG
ncbi:MAG: hypothetical protein ABI741_16550, partial [Ferruginibacter sp.]